MRLFGWIASSVVFLLVLGALGAVLLLSYFSRDLPDYSQLANYRPPVTTRLHASDGRLMAEYWVENRLFVPIAAMPDHVIRAFISAEDQNFYHHFGIDITGVARAMLTNLRNLGSERRPVGASTITQQIAKNFLLGNELSYTRKIREALLAIRIERAFTKEQILELYLNQIYLGRNAYGVAAAALSYFNKSLTDLTVGEAAFLAALPKAPNNYNPLLHHDVAVGRRDYVVDRMLEDGAITVAEANAAKTEPLQVVRRDATEQVSALYFSEEVRRQLLSRYGDAVLYRGGLSVRTTLDPRLQAIADRTLRDGLIEYDRRHGWRGPVATLANFDDWPGRLNAIQRPAGAGTWQLAVVLEVYESGVRIGLNDRKQGTVPFAEMSWAKSWRPDQEVGPAPRRPADVLKLGDVVLVEALDGSATPPAVSPGVPVNESGRPVPLNTYGLRQIPDVQGALVAMDPHTGRVLAVSGGYSYDMSEFNRATQAARQPGSAFKPFVYLAALDAGYTPSTILLDTPLAVDLGGGLGEYRPSNYSEDYLGPQPMRIGIEKSRNIMTVRLLLEIGLQPVHDIARRFGVIHDMPLLYSMALGAGETTPLQLTAAYAMLVNGGRYITPTFIDRIQDRTGRTILRHDERPCQNCRAAWAGTGQATPVLPDDRPQIEDPVSAYQMVSMLEGVTQRGTAARLRALHLPIAGKTGTTNDSRDAWFVGFSPDLAVGVFVGFDTPRTLGPRETGGSVAAPIFGAFMEQALQGRPLAPFRIPPGVSLVRVNPSTGRPAGAGEGAIWEAYRPGTEPNATSFAQPGLDASPYGQATPAVTLGTGGLY